jgi:hypothetical protein
MSITVFLSTGETRAYVPFAGITLHGFDLVSRSISECLNDDVFAPTPTGWTSFAGDGYNQQNQLGE